MSGAGDVRHELLDDDFLMQAELRAEPLGVARKVRAIGYLLVEIAAQAAARGDADLEAELWCTSDELDFAGGSIEDGRYDLARYFLAGAVANTPELVELEAIDDARAYVRGLE